MDTEKICLNHNIILSEFPFNRINHITSIVLWILGRKGRSSEVMKLWGNGEKCRAQNKGQHAGRCRFPIDNENVQLFVLTVNN